MPEDVTEKGMYMGDVLKGEAAEKVVTITNTGQLGLGLNCMSNGLYVVMWITACVVLGSKGAVVNADLSCSTNASMSQCLVAQWHGVLPRVTLCASADLDNCHLKTFSACDRRRLCLHFNVPLKALSVVRSTVAELETANPIDSIQCM